MWGQVVTCKMQNGNARIIPTRVGTRKLGMMGNTGYRDHPHACGDKNAKGDIIKGEKGSSPRVWGQESVSVICKLKIGIIPTRVGTSRKGN